MQDNKHPSMRLRVQRWMRWNYILTCSGAALVALWLTLGELQRLINADTIVPALTSLYRWTWYYWGQNRFGMLTALLAMPIHHPLINLLFQNWMVSFCGLMVFPLAHAYLLGWRTAALSGVIGAGVFLVSGPDSWHMDYLLASQPYAVSGCLGLLGLMALGSESRFRFRVAVRWIFAAILIFLSFWVSLAAVFFIAPLQLMYSFLGRAGQRVQHFLRGLSVIALAAIVNWVITANYTYGGNFGFANLSAIPFNFQLLMVNVCKMIPSAFLLSFLCLAGIGVLGSRICRYQERLRRMVVACLTCLMPAVTYFIVAAASDHIRENGFPARYAIPSIILSVISMAMFASLATERLPTRWRGGLGTVLLMALIVGVTLRNGLPSYGRVRMIVEQRFGGFTRELNDNRCTHILGNYWDVWETVFHANLTNYESRSSPVIWGIAWRSQVTRDLWYPMLDGGRLAVLHTANSDRDWQNEVRAARLPGLTLVRESPRIRIFELTRRND